MPVATEIHQKKRRSRRSTKRRKQKQSDTSDTVHKTGGFSHAHRVHASKTLGIVCFLLGLFSHTPKDPCDLYIYLLILKKTSIIHVGKYTVVPWILWDSDFFWKYIILGCDKILFYDPRVLAQEHDLV